MEVEKIATGIEGFDEVLGGGIPLSNVILVTGLPGTMKSSLVYAIMHNRAKAAGSKCLYVSLEQSRRSLNQQMAAMGLDIEASDGLLHIVDIGSLQKESGKAASAMWMDFLKKMLENKRKIEGIDMIALDSLEALEVLAGFQNRRSDLFFLFEWLRDLGATSFVLTEAPPEQMLISTDHSATSNEEGYLADGIIHLKMHQVTDVNIQRRLRVVKMRSTNHKTGFFALVFEDGRFSVTRALSL